MDKDKMLEDFKQCIKSKSSEQLIKDLKEYNIKVTEYIPGTKGSISIVDEEVSIELIR